MVVNQQEGEEGKRELMELEEEGENEDALSTLTRHASSLFSFAKFNNFLSFFHLFSQSSLFF